MRHQDHRADHASARGFAASPIAGALRAAFAPSRLTPALLLGALALVPVAARADVVPFMTSTIWNDAAGVRSVAAADIDGDGDTDVLSTSRDFDKVSWFENDGSENFSVRTVTTETDGARDVETADVDGDGDIDVLSASYNENKIAWHENDGSGNFTLHTVTTTADGAYAATAADVDGDGDMDLLSASYRDDKVAWYENDGSEGFTLRTITLTADAANSVRAADLDGDGDVDVLSTSRLDDGLAWYENDGSEGFTKRTVATPDGPFAVAVADLDEDGDLDVFSASKNDDRIAWYENDGGETFAVHEISATANGAVSVEVADVDGDGDLDVLSASEADNKIAWYDNDGSQGFTLRTINDTAMGAQSVVTADVDGDGDTDVVSGSFTDSSVIWYENQYACAEGTLQFRTDRMVVSEADQRRPVIVERTGGICGAVGVSYAVSGGNAAAGLDYANNVGGTLSWPDGDGASRHFNVRVLADTLDEPNESVLVVLLDPTGGATLGDSSVRLGIRDDDDPPVLSISGPADVTEGNDVTFTLSLDAKSGYDVEVNLGLAGSATRAVDFGFQGARVIIPAGTLSVTRDLKAGATDVYSDGIADDGETIHLPIASLRNATLHPTQNSLTVTISDP